MGFWSVEELGSESGFGVILGTGVTIFNSGKHNLQLGVEFAPMFTDPTIHNIGFTPLGTSSSSVGGSETARTWSERED